MRLEGPAKLLIQIKSDWLLICFTFVTKSPGSCCGLINTKKIGKRSYLLHGCDVIRIFKLCIEERGVSRVLVLLCSLKMRMMSHQM